MKIDILKIGNSFIFIALMIAGCHDKNEPGPLSYYGKVSNLNQRDGCQNIIEIIEKSENGK